MRRIAQTIFGVLLAGICISIVGSQEPSSVIRVKTRLVEVYATVFDHKGHFVDGLARENFQISEDSRPQKILNFEVTTQKLSCAILLDTTGSMAEALPRVKNSVIKLIDNLGEHDSIAIYTFDQRLVVRQDFTEDKDAAKRAVLRTRAGGQTALFDAIAETAQETSAQPGKKAMIIFTDGDDNASVLTASSAITRATKVGIPLFSIAEGEAQHSLQLKKILTGLSEQTGGTSYHLNHSGEIDQVFTEIQENLRHLYLMTYEPPASQSDGKWRQLNVLVQGPTKYKVRAKQGYYPN